MTIDGYTDFMEAYHEYNRQYNSVSLNYHWNAIRQLSKDLYGSIKTVDQLFDDKKIINQQAEYEVNQLISVTESNNFKNDLNQYIYFGESLNSCIRSLIEYGIEYVDKRILRRMVYHFLELAELYDDQRLIRIAVEIGEQALKLVGKAQ